MSPKKIIFLTIVGLVAVIFIGIIIWLQGASKPAATGDTGPEKISIWLVGEDTAPWEELAASFQKASSRYAATKFEFIKFARYSDYESVVLNALADGRGPDILTVSSQSETIFSGKTTDLPAQYVPEFAGDFLPLFGELIVRKTLPGAWEDGVDVVVEDIKWVPMGYESMGLYVNRKVARTLRRGLTWDALDTTLAEIESQGIVGLAAWLGNRFLPNSRDIIELFLVQNSVKSIANIGGGGGGAALQTYLDYASGSELAPTTTQISEDEFAPITERITPSSLIADMERDNLTLIDMFARGKVAAMLGYPSLMREIDYSVKRAAERANLDLSVINIPQNSVSEGAKAINLARYQYLALSNRTSDEHKAAGADFLAFLASSGSQSQYLTSNPLLLPARTDLVESQSDLSISETFPNAKKRSFMGEQVDNILFDSRVAAAFSEGLNTLIERAERGSAIATRLGAFVSCREKQLFSLGNLDGCDL